MDAVDVDILEALESNPKLGLDELAVQTGVDKAEVQARITSLEKSGVIRKYKTVIDWDKTGVEYVYAVIELKINLERDKGYEGIAKRIAGFEEVRSVRLMSGGYDLSITVRGKSMRDVAFFVAEKISTLEQVVSTATHFVLKTYKEDGVTLYPQEQVKRLAVSP